MAKATINLERETRKALRERKSARQRRLKRLAKRSATERAAWGKK